MEGSDTDEKVYPTHLDQEGMETVKSKLSNISYTN